MKKFSANLSTRLHMGAAATALIMCCATGAAAQVVGILPPEQTNIDEHSVDLSSGRYFLTVPAGSIGPQEAPISFVYAWGAFGATGRTNNNFGYLSRGGEGGNVTVTLVIGGSTAVFGRNVFLSGGYARRRGAGGALTEASDGQSFIYYAANGVKYTFGIPTTVGSNKAGYCNQNAQTGWNEPCVLLLLSVANPNGDQIDLNWTTGAAATSGSASNFARINNITSNRGYRATYLYNQNTLSFATVANWLEVNGVTFANLARPDATFPSVAISFPATSLPTTAISNLAGETWVVTQGANGPNLGDANLVTKVERPGGLVGDTTITYGTRSFYYGITSINSAGTQTNYNIDTAGGVLTTVRTESDGATDRFTFVNGTNGGQPISHTDGLNRTVQYETDLPTRNITKVTFPEGNSASFSYMRNNVSLRTTTAKPGSGLPSLSDSASYASDCANPVTCNLPLSVTDKRGNVTSYTYDPIQGGVLTATKPAVDGVSPVTRYAYVQRYAWISNGAGGFTPASTPIWLLSEERTCRTSTTIGNACAAGATDEVVTSYEYGPNAGPNNLLLRGIIVTADGVSLRTCFNYDAAGNKTAETAPRANLTTCS